MSPPFQGARKLQVPVQRQYDLGQVTDLISLGLDPAFVLLLLESRIEFFTQIGNQLRRNRQARNGALDFPAPDTAARCLVIQGKKPFGRQQKIDMTIVHLTLPGRRSEEHTSELQ